MNFFHTPKLIEKVIKGIISSDFSSKFSIMSTFCFLFIKNKPGEGVDIVQWRIAWSIYVGFLGNM